MTFKKFVSFSLFFALSFSVVHEYVYSVLDTKHCSVDEYVTELSHASEHGDICDIHFEYHQAFVLTEAFSIKTIDLSDKKIISNRDNYYFLPRLTIVKPPIA